MNISDAFNFGNNLLLFCMTVKPQVNSLKGISTNSVWSNKTAESVPAEQNNSTSVNSENNVTKESAEEIRKNVIDILKSNESLKFDESKASSQKLLDLCIKKYTSIKSVYPNLSYDETSTRINNYVEGYLYHNMENLFGLQSQAEEIGMDLGYSQMAIESKEIKNAKEAKNNEAYKAAFHELASRYIAYYDSKDNNGRINIEELYESKIQDAIEKKGSELSNDEVQKITEDLINEIGLYDQNNDKQLDKGEIAAYLWARNSWQGNEENMTYSEHNDFEKSINGLKTLTGEQKEAAQKAQKILSENGLKLKNLPADLSSLNLKEDDLNTLKQGLEPLRVILKMNTAIQAVKNGYEGLKLKD